MLFFNKQRFYRNNMQCQTTKCYLSALTHWQAQNRIVTLVYCPVYEAKRCSKLVQKYAIKLCQAVTIIETSQMVLSQFKNFLPYSRLRHELKVVVVDNALDYRLKAILQLLLHGLSRIILTFSKFNMAAGGCHHIGLLAERNYVMFG